MSLGVSLTIFSGLDQGLQKQLLKDFKSLGMNFGVKNINDFIDKVFTLVAIRNCVMHCNSLEILVRYYNPATHKLRKNRNKEICKMINELSIENSTLKSKRTVYSVLLEQFTFLLYMTFRLLSTKT